MLFPISTEIPFLAQFTNSKAGAAGLTVTVSVVRVPFGGGANTVVISLASATAATEVDSTNQKGLYRYLLSSANTGTAGYYVATFHTAGTVDQADIAALEIVGAAWVAHVDADVSSRAAAADYTTARAAKLDNLDTNIGSRSTYAGGAVASVTGNVGGNVTGSVGSVTGSVAAVTGNIGGNVAGSVGSVTADVGITQAGADKVWSSAARTLTDFGTLVADTAAAVWGAATRTLSAFGFPVTVADKTGYSLSVAPPTAADVVAALDSTSTKLATPTSALLLASAYTAPLDSPATTAAVQTGLTAQGYSAGRALLLDNLNAAMTSRLAASGYTAPPTLAAIIAGVLDELLSAHTVAGSVAAGISAASAGGGGGATAAELTTALLDELISAHTIPGSVAAEITLAALAGSTVLSGIGGSGPPDIQYQPAIVDLYVTQGDTYSRQFTFLVDSTTPVDWTGTTAALVVRHVAGDPAPLFTLTETSGITLGGATGQLGFVFSPGQTALLRWASAVYELKTTGPGGGPIATALHGTLLVTRAVVRP